MGLLDKTNPQATCRSVIRWAIFGGFAGPLFILLHIWGKIPLRNGWIILLAAVILGAAVGALMEWQLDDGPYEDE